MSQDRDLSHLSCVTPDPGKCQWVKCKGTGIDDAYTQRTHTMGMPLSMPGVIIFVHGVNSEGEWYHDASGEFAKGLNQRLGRDDLKQLEKDSQGDQNKITAHRYLSRREGQRIPSPIIPFYWGYKCERTQRKMVRGTEQLGSTPAWTDMHGNPLRSDGAWGGGPFQNGGAALSSFWLPTGFRKDI
uniref:T6SS effector phospholipase Tle3 domain-containing protein n=1 Tax=Pseudacidovorax intermedius TaxID=433924 RepID=UPI003F69B79C